MLALMLALYHFAIRMPGHTYRFSSGHSVFRHTAVPPRLCRRRDPGGVHGVFSALNAGRAQQFRVTPVFLKSRRSAAAALFSFLQANEYSVPAAAAATENLLPPSAVFAIIKPTGTQGLAK